VYAAGARRPSGVAPETGLVDSTRATRGQCHRAADDFGLIRGALTGHNRSDRLGFDRRCPVCSSEVNTEVISPFRRCPVGLGPARIWPEQVRGSLVRIQSPRQFHHLHERRSVQVGVPTRVELADLRDVVIVYPLLMSGGNTRSITAAPALSTGQVVPVDELHRCGASRHQATMRLSENVTCLASRDSAHFIVVADCGTHRFGVVPPSGPGHRRVTAVDQTQTKPSQPRWTPRSSPTAAP